MLTFVGQYFYIHSNFALTAILVPALTFIGWDFSVNDNVGLLSIFAPTIKTIATTGNFSYGLYICDNNAQVKYSPEIVSAASGKICNLGTNSCFNALC